MIVLLLGKRYSGVFGLVLGVLLLIFSGQMHANFEPAFKPALEIQKTTGDIHIDGRLRDLGWKNAAIAGNFAESNPGDNVQPAVETRALITYDDKNLYVAFVCYDNPDEIRATLCDRDQFFNDDAVCLKLDTYGNASWAYRLYVNPYGVQKDMLWTAVAGEDIGFDLVWHSAAQITDSGYQVEMAIPFTSMRFPDNAQQSWRIDFYRPRPRDHYYAYVWAAHDRDEACEPCQWGTVSGIESVQPGKGLELLPTYVATQSGQKVDLSNPGSEFDNGKISGEISLGAKYSISSNITLDAAFNPDFSQIEADAAQIDVNTTIALFYPERRPFFQEGTDVFRTLFNSFYTRTVNDPVFSAKLIGRLENTTFGFISAHDENTPYTIPLEEYTILLNSGKSTVNAVRAIQSVGGNSQLGFLATDRRFENEGSGTILALDHDIWFTRRLGFDGQYVLSHTKEPDDISSIPDLSAIKFDHDRHNAAFDGESYYGHGTISRLKYFARSWHFMLNYSEVSPSYRTETGYDPLMDYRDASGWTEYVFYIEKGLLNRIYPQTYISKRWDFDGGLIADHYNFNLGSSWNFAQTNIEIFYGRSSERFSGIEYDNLWETHLNLDSRPLDQLGGNLFVAKRRNLARGFGTKGDEYDIQTTLTIKPFDRLLIEPTFSYLRSTDFETGDELYEGYITRTRLRYQATKEISLRLVVQYNDFYERLDVDPLLTYRISPFSVFYAGSTYDYDNIRIYSHEVDDNWQLTSRQFFVKLRYLFRT